VVEPIFEADVKKVKSSALIGQKRVNRERESKGLVIPIFDTTLNCFTNKSRPVSK
jgi:hypothetical protein